MPKKKVNDKKFYQYIEDVESGSEAYGELIQLSVKRFLSDINKNEFEFDYEKGFRVVDFIQRFCRHHKGEWAKQSFVFEPHQHFFFINLFGWVRDDGTRRFRSSYKEVARKNAKTTEEALAGIYHLTKDDEQGAQVYAGATKEAQAMIVVNDAGQIIKSSPSLTKRFNLFELRGDIKRIYYPPSNGIITPIGRDSKTQDGFDPSMAILDEYHAHPTSHTRDVIESGMGARRQPLSNIITTAGFNKQGPCYKLRHTASDILKGKLTDESFLAIIHSMDKDDDWHDQTKWIKGNPNLHSSVKFSYLIDQFTKAKNEGGQKEVDFRTKNLNQWTDAADVWVTDELWKANTHKSDPSYLWQNKISCRGGLDLASTADINAFVLIFPEFREASVKVLNEHGKQETRIVKVSALIPYFWIPQENVKEMSRRDHVDYQLWIDQGYIKTTPGNVTDYDFIERDIYALRDKFNLQRIALDPWNAGSTSGRISNQGIATHELRQGYASLNEPSKTFERMAKSKQFEHFNNPVLSWMLGNVALDRDAAGNIKPNKAKSINKIDGISATINAIADWLLPLEENKEAGMFIIAD